MNRVLLITRREEDRSELKAILAGTSWVVVDTTSVAEPAFPIILYDRDYADGPWQESVRSLSAARTRTCVILVSGVMDQYLWDEVVHHGGFDVLTRPFQKRAVLSMLEFALAHWKTAWPATG